MSLGVQQGHHVVLCQGAFCVSRQHRLCCRWPGHTFMFYSWKADVFIHRLWNNVYDQWIMSNLPSNDTEQEAQQVAANPRWGRFSTETPLGTPIKIHRWVDRRRQPQNSTVKATLSTQHHKHVLLNCILNDTAWDQVLKWGEKAKNGFK